MAEALVSVLFEQYRNPNTSSYDERPVNKCFAVGS